MTKAIRKLIGLLGILAVAGCLSPAFAQSGFSFGGAVNAYDFAFGITPNAPAALLVTAGSNTSGTYTVTLAYGQTATAGGLTFSPISTSIPITIGAGASTETVTPSSVSCSTPAVQYTCQFTATFANAHGNGDLVRSSDFGLQEAASYAAGQGGGLVALSAAWFKGMGLSLTNKTNLGTALAGYKSLSATVQLLDWSGATGASASTEALSYTAASGSAYAVNTGHILY